LRDYIPNKGSDGETSSEIDDNESTTQKKESIRDDYSAIDETELIDR